MEEGDSDDPCDLFEDAQGSVIHFTPVPCSSNHADTGDELTGKGRGFTPITSSCCAMRL
jgi:hypothetical protein